MIYIISLITSLLNSQEYQYNNIGIERVSKRIQLNDEVILNKINIEIDGKQNSEMAIKIIQNQRQNQFPDYSDVIYDEIVSISKNGTQTIEIDLGIYISNQYNIFIVVESFNENKVLSSKEKVYSCINEFDELFTNNYIFMDGNWKIVQYDLKIYPEIEELSDNKNKFKEKIILEDFTFKSLSVSDYNNDGKIDILANDILLENIGDEYKETRFDVTDSLIMSFFIDANKDGKQDVGMITYNDTTLKFSVLIYINKNNIFIDFYHSILDIEGIDNYNILDINNDGFLDIYINSLDYGDRILLNNGVNGFSDFTNTYFKHSQINSKSLHFIDIDKDNKVEFLCIGSEEFYLIFTTYNSFDVIKIKTEEIDFNSVPHIYVDRNGNNHIIQTFFESEDDMERQIVKDVSISEDLELTYSNIENNNDLVQNCNFIDINNNLNFEKLFFTSCDCRYSGIEFGNGIKQLLINDRKSNILKNAIIEDFDGDNSLDILGFNFDELKILINEQVSGNNIKISGDKVSVTTTIEYYIGNEKYVKYNVNNKGICLQKSDIIILPMGTENTIDSLFLYQTDGKRIHSQYEIEKDKSILIDFENESIVEKNKSQSCEIFPQPFENNMFFKLLNFENKTICITLYSTTGEQICEVYRGLVSSEVEIIEFNDATIIMNMSIGVYYYKIDFDNKSISGKISRLK